MRSPEVRFFFYCLAIWVMLFFLSYLFVPFFKALCQDNGPYSISGLVGNYLQDYGWLISFFAFINEYYVFIFNWSFTELATNDLLKTNQLNVHFLIAFNSLIYDEVFFEFPVSTLRVKLNQESLIFCDVINNSSTDMVFTTIYSVSPPEALPYIEKVQCFCYDDQIIESKQNISLPIYFKINSNFRHSPLLTSVSDIFICYSVFPVQL